MKKIILSGKSGFIGSNIFENLVNSHYKVEDIDLRKSREELHNLHNENNFDLFIHSAGIHPYRQGLDDRSILKKSKELLKKIELIFSKSKKVILISSFVNLIDHNKKIITETNKIYSSKKDSYYKKSKVLTEKYFKLLKKKYKNELIIIYPCHVIGPNDLKESPNGAFLINNFKKKISLCTNVYYPITDVREISNYIIYCINNNLSSNQKILIDRNLNLIEYFELLKSYSKKIKLILKIDIKFYYFAHQIFNISQKLFNLRNNPFPISTYYYLKLNPKVEPQIDNDYKIKYKLEKTILDTVKYFKL